MAIMLELRVETVFIVGAGFSHHAGLPLTSGLTEAMLEAREFGHGRSRIIVDFLSEFIHDVFDHSTKASAKLWPNLEDIFTCVDLAANSGHHLGSSFSPADLRTVRRAMLARIVRMLEQKYNAARKKKDLNWRNLDNFFARTDSRDIGFISMNWDTVIERKLQVICGKTRINYGCDARPANFADLPETESDWFPKNKKKVAAQRQIIPATQVLSNETEMEKETTVVKIHGSANWLYCDSCRRLFWFHPDQVIGIADQLIRSDDFLRIGRFFGKKQKSVKAAVENLKESPIATCPCVGTVPLGTRIATFSYRKALDFSMFQKSWFAAEDLLRSAKRWVFIGYSLPAADYEFKYLLKRVQLSRKQEPELIIVSGGDSSNLRRTRENYRKFFGRIIKDKNCFAQGLTREAVDAICS
jgi:hypothetical protein